MSWEVQKTPANYTAPNGEEWCIIDTENGDIFGFYEFKFDARKDHRTLTQKVGIRFIYKDGSQSEIFWS